MNLKDELYPIEVIYTKNDDTMSAMAAQFSKQGKKCLCFLRGAPSESFTRKLLCALADVAYEKTRDGTAGEAEWVRLANAAKRLASGNVQTDSNAVSDKEILAKCKGFSSADVVLILSLAK